MSYSNILGLIFANSNENNLPELTAYRTTGSVPFGGKFRLVDFTLSNMSNSEINNVGIIINNNFQSLMDHLESGAAWDLAHRMTGLKILPPYGEHSFRNIVEAISNLHGYIEESNEDYVLIAPSDVVENIDYRKVYEYHLEKKADATFVYAKKFVDEVKSDFRCLLELDDNGKVKKITSRPVEPRTCNITTGALLIKKDLLMTLVKKAVAENKTDYIKDILMNNDTLKVYGYEETGFCEFVTSMKEYYDINMKLFEKEVRDELFNPKRPIYTKIRDDSPSKYGLDSSVVGSLIAQGCIIEGTVENSIISKGVYIGKNAKVSNCIIMQDTIINEGCDLSHIVIDKDVIVNKDQNIHGCETYPMYIAKRSVV